MGAHFRANDPRGVCMKEHHLLFDDYPAATMYDTDFPFGDRQPATQNRLDKLSDKAR